MKIIPVPIELVDLIHSNSHFLIFSHLNPDGDCLASSLALSSCLKRMGKTVCNYNEGPFLRKEILQFADQFSQKFPENFAQDIENRTENYVAIILDCSQADRIGKFKEGIRNIPKVVVDHHSEGGNYGDIRFINPSAPSVSLLVLQLIYALGTEPNSEEAWYIFFAFATDTGFFSFLDSNNAETFKYIAKLSEKGVSPKEIYHSIFPSQSLRSKLFLARIISRVESYFEGQFLYSWALYNDICEFGFADRDTASIYSQLMNVENVEILLLLSEKEPGIFSGNIRTRNRIDAGRLAARYGGGGHARAAGFSSTIPLQELFQDFKAQVAKGI